MFICRISVILILQELNDFVIVCLNSLIRKLIFGLLKNTVCDKILVCFTNRINIRLKLEQPSKNIRSIIYSSI